MSLLQYIIVNGIRIGLKLDHVFDISIYSRVFQYLLSYFVHGAATYMLLEMHMLLLHDLFSRLFYICFRDAGKPTPKARVKVSLNTT